MSNKSKLIVGIFLCLMAFRSESKHIIGGEVTYICTATDGFVGGMASYDISFIMYRDKLGGGANYDYPANFGIYRKTAGGQWETVDSTFAYPQFVEDIELTKDPCVVPPNNLAAEKGEYHFTVQLEILATSSYMIAYQRCCRNNTINNIIRPDMTGAAYQVEISPEAQISGNSSPYFNDFPPLVICAGIELKFDHSASDAEGDSLVYSYYNPLHAGGLRGSSSDFPGSPFACDGVTPSVWNCRPPFPLVNFASPFTYDVPLGGAPIVSINKFTGLIKGTPTVLGQFVVGVKVEEYRDGKLIGAIFRDFQFNVTPCDPKIHAEIIYDELVGYKKYVVNSCGDEKIDFINISQDAQYIHDQEWIFHIKGEKDTLTSWNASVTFPGVGDYYGQLILNPGTQCVDSADIYIHVFPDVTADFMYEYDTCVASEVQFTDLSWSGSGKIEKWFWDLEEDYRSVVQHPSYFYDSPGIKNVKLTVEDENECLDTIIRDISYFPAPAIVVVEPSQFTGCVPAILSFQNLSVPIDTTYTTRWSFGDGGTSEELHPVHLFDEPGEFDIQIEIISPIGCRVERTFPAWIKMRQGPLADFYFEPEDPSIIRNTIEFYDSSKDAVGWQWNFGDGVVDMTQNPTHSYQDTGLYVVQLVVTHENHCSDTLVQYIDISPVITYFMPNAFTPNGDGQNEVFIGNGYFTEAMKSFSMRIWSRWGNLVFETSNVETGWNGRKDNVGELLPQGVYVYQVDYIDARGRPVTQKGFATLIR